MQVLERYKSQNLQRVCNFEVNKAQIKNGIRFWFSCYFILLKNKNHQNTTNRMCIKHWNLQCFLSMSLNAFNTTLGKWYIPSLSGGPWGGGYHIYIYILYIQFYASLPRDPIAPPGYISINADMMSNCKHFIGQPFTVDEPWSRMVSHSRFMPRKVDTS